MQRKVANMQRERGEQNRAKMLALMAAIPHSAQQLADALGVTRKAIHHHLTMLTAGSPRQAHIADHRPNPNGHPTPFYLAGNRPDVEYLTYRKPKLPEPIAVTQLERIVAVLRQSPSTTEQIAGAISRSQSSVHKYLRDLRVPGHKQVFIKRWQHPGKRGDLAPVYALGARKDAPKPKETRAERYRKEAANADLSEKWNAKRRVRRRIVKAKVAPNAWLGPLLFRKDAGAAP